MLIIRPYGRSETAYDEKLRRRIRLRAKFKPGEAEGEPGAENGGLVEVGEFAETRPELVIAQWISVIDKIARKPGRGCKPTPEQRKFRQGLGEAAFELLRKQGASSGRESDLERLWWSKIHPYPDGDEGSGQERGRWYRRFVEGEETVDPNAVAFRIREHLYGIRGEFGRRGRIAARADSIARSVPPLPEECPGGTAWSKQDQRTYAEAGNVAGLIRAGADEGRFAMRDAAPFLFEHYGRLFGDKEPLPISEARKRHPGLFALHTAVRDAYRRLLKDRKRKSLFLPPDMAALFQLVKGISGNRDLAGLIRLGKIVHYEATPPLGADEPANVIDNWPDDVSRSRYRTSAGQSEIKRNEAFVRIWRHTIALAAQSLKAWADPDGTGDVLLRAAKLAGDGFDAAAYREKLPLLFGNRAALFKNENEAATLRLALEGWANLRHCSFHFKGRGGFARALRLGLDENPAVPAARELLKRDLSGRRNRMVEALRAAHVEDFYDQEKLGALVPAVVGGKAAQSPMPRFRRVLTRASHAWSRKPWKLRLPPPASRSEMEEAPALLSRYVVVKMLYERVFPGWLETQDDRALNGWIDRAVKRTTNAAQSINKDEFAVARAAGLIELEAGQGIADFFDLLAAETATELRVRRGYEADADNARRQAKYIDDLRCDVVALAFDACLRKLGFGWAMECPGDEPEAGCLNRVTMPPEPSAEEPEDWEAILYFLVHLVPVDAIGRLRHHLLKWSVLEGQPSAEAAAPDRVFGLYLDMHDARFEGAEGVIGAGALRQLFKTEEIFSRVCPAQPGRESHVPFRGLREILRFGALGPLMPVFRAHPVGAAEVEKLAALEKKTDGASTVARQQSRRDELHDKWARNRQEFSKQDKSSYRDALAGVVRHRRLAAHVRLNDHARLYRLLMEVLGRLVDYAGLWERDLYFATLGLVHLRGVKAEDVFTGEGLEKLRKGRIVEAARKLDNSQGGDGRAVFGQLERLFGRKFLNARSGTVRIRNDLMHFDMLRDKFQPFDLTAVVNDTRRLVSYDRKLKNAVSRSIIELMARENLILSWEMADHSLVHAKIGSRKIRHLGDAGIAEALHGEKFVAMAAELFSGAALPHDGDILSAAEPRRDRPGNGRGKKRRTGKAGARRRRVSARQNGWFVVRGKDLRYTGWRSPPNQGGLHPK